MPRTAISPLNRACPRCGNKVSYHTNAQPHPNWKELASEPWDGETDADEESETYEPADAGGILVDGEAQVEIINGQPFVAAKAIHALGNIMPQAGDIVRLNGKYYELGGLSMRRPTFQMWWLEPFDFDQWAQQSVRSLPEYDGPSSDDIAAYYDPDTKHQVYYNPNTGEHVDPKEAS